MDNDQQHNPPRGTDWITDGIGIDGFQNRVVIRFNDDTCMNMSHEALREFISGYGLLERTIEDLKQKVNEREPAPFLRTIMADLDECGNEAGNLRGEGAAGKIMWGQAQAYRDAVARIKACLPKTWRYD